VESLISLLRRRSSLLMLGSKVLNSMLRRSSLSISENFLADFP
jgi:hypothetical protein